MVKFPLTLDRETCKDGFAFKVYKPSEDNPPCTNSSEPQSTNIPSDGVDEYETVFSGRAIPSSASSRSRPIFSGREDRRDFRRPASRQSFHRSGGHPNARMPPLKVRRYPFVLDGHMGFYTLAQISRYANIAPRRGTAMFLRRFRLINEILDRRHAVGYENRRILAQPGDSPEDDEKRIRWKGHGASKLRNEIPLEDLVGDDDSDAEFSFGEFVDCSFESRYSYDSDASFKSHDIIHEDCDDFENNFDAHLREILGMDTEFKMLDPSDDEIDETETY